MNEVVALIDDILEYVSNQGREVDQLCFGYDGGNLVIVTDDDYRLIVMHMQPDEVDFIAKAARAFLIDFQVGLFAEQLSGENPRLTGSGLTRELPPVVIPGEFPEEPSEQQGAAPETAPTQSSIPLIPKGQPVAATDSAASPAPRIIPSPGVERSQSEAQGEAEASAPGAHLAPNQPESTLPQPRKPKER